MGNYAKVLNNTVVNVIVADASFFDTFVDTSPGQWIQTSYNTRGNVYYLPNSDTPGPDQTLALRANYAGIGYNYDPTVVINGISGVFYPPQPYPSWVLNTTTYLWEAPTPPGPMPTDGQFYQWDEATTSWAPVVGGP